MAVEKEEKAANNRCYCTLSAPTQKLLERLATRGTHGTDRASVMTFLIMTGLQQAIEKGYVSPED